jgi:quinol-cytochrome oxidoreductase complex cytochrome b subunit
MELQNRSEEHEGEEKEHDVPFFPDVLLAELSFAIAVVGLLAIFVSLFPPGLGEKFDPLNPPTILEPEWYFMGFYQFLKTQSVQPSYGIVLMVGLGVFMILVPFLDRGSERRPLGRPIFTAIAFVVIVEFLALTLYGYMSPGQVGSFSDIPFVMAFAATNLVALGLILLVFAASRHAMRGVHT